MKTKHVITALVLFLSATLFGQGLQAASGTLQGQAVSQADQKPVPGTTILILGTNLGTITDNAGRFTIKSLEVGTYSVQATCVGFEPTTRSSVRIYDSDTTEITILLVPAQKSSNSDTRPGSSKAKEILNGNKTARPNAALGQLRGGRAGETDFQAEGESNSPAVNQSGRIAPYTPGIPQTNFHAPTPQYVPILPPFDMYFHDYGTNGWISTTRDRLSTFALDVDDASYNLVKQYLTQGNIPPIEAIRVEEFINHFDYGYNPPQNGKFRVFTETTESPFDNGVVFLKIGVKGRETTESRRKPLRLTFVIDVSGSMGYDNRLELVKQSLQLIVRQLAPDDQVGIVAFGSTASVILNPVSGDRKREIERAIGRLRPEGSTFAEAGLRLGYEMASEQFERGCSNRIVLCSDGVANVGRTGPNEIMREVTSGATTGITLSTFGFGMGNYNDVLLEQLAKKGNGRYAYINNWDEARRQFVDQLLANVQVLGRDVKVQVTFDPAVVASYRQIGYENRAVADNKFRDNRADGGEIGAGHEVTALYELRLKGKVRQAQIATVDVRWKEAEGNSVVELREYANFNARNANYESVRPELKLAVVASRFAELLKETAYSANTTYDDLYDLAAQVQRELPNDQTRELAELIGQARTLNYGNDYWRAEDDDAGSNYKH